MKKIFGFFKQRWVVSLIGILAIAALVWFVGPLIAIAGREPLLSEMSRMVVILVILLVWGVNNLRKQMVAHRSNKSMIEDIVEVEPAAPDQGEEEVATLRARFEESMAILKKSKKKKGGGNPLYELPWYVIIGPPGSGKTTALKESGLHFPLSESMGDERLGGVGGTRDCDWWFTDEAVLLDTAGRYSTQDSDAEVDRTAWLGFLDLLKKYRKRRPINGVLVAISISDLMVLTARERQAHVAAIKQRINELYEHFGIRFPIYVLMTKVDLVAGFTEFFEDLGHDERQQAWGFTFPLEDGGKEKDLEARFESEFDALLSRLSARLLTRLHEERDPQRRALIFGFPRQMASLKAPLKDFLLGVFRASRYDEPRLWRGMYFTSGTQVGTPVDRVVNALARTFALDKETLASFSGSGRSYFINHVLKQVVFEESGLAGSNRRLERQRAWLQRGAYVGVIALMLISVIAWTTSYFANQRYLAGVEQHAEALRQELADLPPGRGRPIDALSVLNAARAVPGGYGSRDQSAPLSAGFGLYQGRKIGEAGTAAYRRVLNRVFLPRLLNDLEGQLRLGRSDTEYLFEALRVYLMLDKERLDDASRFDPATVQAWMDFQWESALQDGINEDQFADLRTHLAALLESMPSPMPVALDETLIERTRDILMQMPLEQRVYGRIKRSAQRASLPEFSITSAAGSAAGSIFRRRSRAPLTEGIPGLYTYRGFHEFFDTEAKRVTETVADESWILGEQGEVSRSALAALGQGSDERKKLDAAVLELYLTDFAKAYQDLLGDLTLLPFSNNRVKAADALRLLGSKSRSPLKQLLEAVVREVSLERSDQDQKEPGLVDKSRSAVQEASDKLKDVLGRAPKVPNVPRMSSRQEQIKGRTKRAFGDYQSLMQSADGGSTPFDDVLDLVDQLYLYFDRVNSNSDPDGALQNTSAELANLAAALSREATGPGMPEPLADILSSVSSQSKTLGSQRVYANLNGLWQSQGLAFCRNAIEGRYPVDRAQAIREIRRNDFSDFFGAGGVMDSFFNDYLKEYADISGSNWRWRAGGEMKNASRQSLAQFRRAKIIRDTFFRAGNLSVAFDLKPITMDAAITRFTLDVEGQSISYGHGPAVPRQLVWPGPGPREVRIEISPPASSASGLTASGDWAWFKILDSADMRETNRPEHFEVTFRVGGRSIQYQLKAASAFNPFSFTELENFRCPAKL